MDIGEAGPATATATVHAIQAGVPEAVVGRPLVGIAEHRVGLAQLLELGFGVGASAVAVGVMLHSELAVGPLELVVGCAPLDAQYLVVIPQHL